MHDRVLQWYAQAARDLPWRRPDATPWGVLVSEVMLQQTQVSRVEPVWRSWMMRWPAPADLAAEAPGQAVRAWGRLGYPRRALRLHEAAVAMVERHGGEVPSDHADLLRLPGVGAYTAAAVATFAFGARHAVLDTNVRRVFARAVDGMAQPTPTGTAAEVRRASGLVPDEPAAARIWAVAAMELGALVCTARSPHCLACPVADLCTWRLIGRPAYRGPTRRTQRYRGTDRYVRGLLLAVLRDVDEVVAASAMASVWPDTAQLARALDGLVADGLVEPVANGYRLPRGRDSRHPTGSGVPVSELFEPIEPGVP
jgi:A/G-specific adenine glycosylase